MKSFIWLYKWKNVYSSRIIQQKHFQIRYNKTQVYWHRYCQPLIDLMYLSNVSIIDFEHVLGYGEYLFSKICVWPFCEH